MRFWKLFLPTVLMLATLSGCGYRLAARKGDVGAGKTMAVPTFTNASLGYRIEQRMSEAIRRELAQNTHYRVTSGETGDVVLKGEVLGYGTGPTAFDNQGRASQYAISVTLKVVVTESATSKALFRNDSMTFLDTFQLSQTAGDFVPEDPAALDRLAARFASAIVADLVHRTP